MADVHIGKIFQTEKGKGKISLIYHFDLDSPKAVIVPTPISSINSELEQAEKDALNAGTRVEIAADIVATDNQNKSEIVTAIKKDWSSKKADYNRKFNFEHKFFGDVIIDATT